MGHGSDQAGVKTICLRLFKNGVSHSGGGEVEKRSLFAGRGNWPRSRLTGAKPCV